MFVGEPNGIPATPRNVGIGYQYSPFQPITSLTSYTPAEQVVFKKAMSTYLNFDRVVDPGYSRLTTCLMWQQNNVLPDRSIGREGPHRRGTRWEMFFVDGSMGTTEGYWGARGQDFTIYDGMWQLGGRGWFPRGWTPSSP